MNRTTSYFKFSKHQNFILFGFVGFILSFIFFTGCTSNQNASNRNVAGIYLSGINLLEPDYKVFHENDTLTNIYFRLRSENLLYTRKRTDSIFTANVQVKYELMDEEEKLLDSTTVYFVDYGQNNQKKFLEGIIPLKTETNKNYEVLISFYDANRDNFLRKKISLNRSSPHTAQNFLAKDSIGNIINKSY